MLSMTKASMTANDYKDIVGGGGASTTFTSNMAEGFTSTGGSEPGLDISQFDFVKNASKVYNASIEKDKNRFGA
jgi:hypothetical protein